MTRTAATKIKIIDHVRNLSVGGKFLTEDIK